MPCRDRPVVEVSLSAPYKLQSPTNPVGWGDALPTLKSLDPEPESDLILQSLGSPDHLRLLKMDFLPGFLSPTLRPIRSRAFSSSCCCMFRSDFVSSFPRTSDPVAGFNLNFSLITWQVERSKRKGKNISGKAKQFKLNQFKNLLNLHAKHKGAVQNI